MIELTAKQSEAVEDFFSPHREILYDGAARSGKTFLICWSLVNLAIEYPGTRYLIARLRANHLEMSIWRQTLIPILQEWCPGAYRLDKVHRTVCFYNGSEIIGFALEDSTDRATKFMGQEYSMVFVNEISQINYSAYQMIKTRCVQNKGLPNKIFSDCNPTNQHSWIHRYFIEGLDPDNIERKLKAPERIFRRGPWLPKDNTHLSQDALDMFESLSGVQYERLALGRWVSAEGLVFPEYESAVVEAFAIKQDWDIYAVVDFGYSNAFAVSFWAEHYADETYYLIDEYYIREKTVAEHCAVLRGFTSPWRQGIVKPAVWVSDHDAEDRATMHREGIVTIPAKKDIISGIDAVRKMFLAKKGWKIRIFNTCTNALSELSSYHYPEKKTGTDADEKPVKGNDHLCDTIRYFAAWKSTGTTIKNFGRLRIR